MNLLAYPILLAIQTFPDRICNYVAQYIPTNGAQISPSWKQSLLNRAVSHGAPNLTDPTKIQWALYFRPIEYAHTSLLIAARKFYYYASASANNQAYIENIAAGVRALALDKFGNQELRLNSLRAKAKEFLNEKIKDSSFNYTTLSTYALTGGAAPVLRWGARYILLSWIYPDIPYLSTAATLTTLYLLAVATTPYVRSELLDVKPLDLPEFENIYDEDMHNRISDEAQRIFQIDEVDEFRNNREQITLPKVIQVQNPFSQLVVSAPPPPSRKYDAPAATTSATSAPAPVDQPDPPLVTTDPPSISDLQSQWAQLQSELKNKTKDSVDYLRHYAKMDRLKAQIFELEKNWDQLAIYEKRVTQREKQATVQEGQDDGAYLEIRLKELEPRIAKAKQNSNFALQGALSSIQDHIYTLKPPANVCAVSPAKPPPSSKSMDSDDDS